MITVVGSLNADYVVSVDRRPELGETISSNSLDILYGGKGGNQAISASKIGGEVSFIGSVGSDLNGKGYLKELKQFGINTENVSVINNIPTGVSLITIEDNDNCIIYSEGANGKLSVKDIESSKRLIEESDIVVVQFEINHNVIEKVLEIANQKNVPVILNPAPYKPFPIKWLDKITYITPNEQEFKAITNCDSYNNKYIDKFIITLGKNGVAFHENNERKLIKAPEVEVRDTTGAGDTFNGVLAYYLSTGSSLQNACEKAVYAASLSTTKLGTHSGIPTEEELKAFIKKSNNGLLNIEG
ncbi:ribokinase [Lentibacillus sp. N15]|uniref:ribokinase n=1 Tax=Lentibacillus songyuanensis TaxID=3136161 RepID=UPI0031B9E01B